MRVVLDTNVVLSGVWWTGAPADLLMAARAGRISPLISEALLDELKEVAARPKFARARQRNAMSAPDLVAAYLALVEVAEAAPLTPVITADPDDDAVLACAVGGDADAIVSGDPHLLALRSYAGIPILAVREFLQRLGPPPP